LQDSFHRIVLDCSGRIPENQLILRIGNLDQKLDDLDLYASPFQESQPSGEDLPDLNQLMSMLNSALIDKEKTDPNILSDPVKLNNLEIELTDFVFIKLTPSKKDQPVKEVDRKTKNWKFMQERYVKPAIDKYKKQKEEEKQKEIERQKRQASMIPTLDLNVVIPRSVKLVDQALVNVAGNKDKELAYNRLKCILLKIYQNEKTVRDTYISYNDYSTYIFKARSGVPRSELIKEGYIDPTGKSPAGTWNAFQRVQDFLKLPNNFESTKTDKEYFGSLIRLYNDLAQVIDALARKQHGSELGMLQWEENIAKWIQGEARNKLSIYGCFG
jgi:hypothetical protein